jgi:hypothetical protein
MAEQENWSHFAGQRVVSAKVTIPYAGIWTARITFASDSTENVTTFDIGTTSTLVLGDLSMVGTVQRSTAFGGVQRALLVGGYGGWSKNIPSLGYSVPTGVPLSMVVGDVAITVGEKVSIATDLLIGLGYMRQAGIASRVLRHVAGSNWYIGTDGATIIGSARPSSAISSDFTTIDYSGDGRYVIATEVLSDWMPGRTFTSSQVAKTETISSVTHEVTGEGSHRLSVLVGPSTYDRIAAPIRSIVLGELERLAYLGHWEYVVQASDGTTIDATPSAGASANAPIELPGTRIDCYFSFATWRECHSHGRIDLHSDVHQRRSNEAKYRRR